MNNNTNRMQRYIFKRLLSSFRFQKVKYIEIPMWDNLYTQNNSTRDDLHFYTPHEQLFPIYPNKLKCFTADYQVVNISCVVFYRNKQDIFSSRIEKIVHDIGNLSVRLIIENMNVSDIKIYEIEKKTKELVDEKINEWGYECIRVDIKILQ